MTTIAIVFHSGYGHTAKVAEHIAAGVADVAGAQAKLIAISATGDITEADWATIAAADGVGVFGGRWLPGRRNRWCAFLVFGAGRSPATFLDRDNIGAGFGGFGFSHFGFLTIGVLALARWWAQ